MARIHRITHPILGVTTWKDMQAAVKDKHLCSWCHSPVPKGFRTRCGSQLCAEMIWQSQSWTRCIRLHLRSENKCRICGGFADEVDHIVPVSLGGTGDASNLRSLCSDCHKKATNRLRKEKLNYVA